MIFGYKLSLIHQYSLSSSSKSIATVVPFGIFTDVASVTGSITLYNSFNSYLADSKLS